MKNIRFIFLLISVFPSLLYGQYPNILVSQTYYPEEPAICINPKNLQQIVAGANTDNYYFSNNGGLTWEQGNLSSTYGVWGDPVIIVDTAGAFYYFHLSDPAGPAWIDRIVCQKSTDGGDTWNNGTYTGLNGNKNQDKPWGIVDRTNNNIYVCWTQFDIYGSVNPADSSHIMFSRSVDGALTWSQAVRIDQKGGDCLDMDSTDEGAVPAVGPDGEIYVAWAGPDGLVFTKSTDGGQTWPSANQVICPIPGGWDYAIPGIYRANGLPFTVCDLSNGPYRGNIYINWSDQRNGETDTDVWFIKSTDGGNSWTSPLRVNDDPPGKQQFFTSMTVDQSTGYIYVVFYDRRNYNDNRTDVWMGVSRDGGDTFQNFMISESPFLPVGSIFFGDYTYVSAINNIVRPVWTRLQNGDLSIYTALMDSIFTGISTQPGSPEPPFTLEQNFPNPVQQYTYFSYKIHQPSTVTLKVFDIFGRPVATPVMNEFKEPGKYIVRFDAAQNHLSPGFYYFSMTSGEQVIKRKMILE
jgi:hypothetical protein